MARRVPRLVFVVVAIVLAGAAIADVPDVLSVQGVLKEPSGQPTNHPVNMHFRIFRGGDDTTLPSTGILAYHETATVTPEEGVFWHWIGTGVAQTDCPFHRCLFNASVFAPGDIPLWIESTLDPDGIEDSGDEETLLPRTRVGTVGYAYRVATLEGATGGNMSGTIAADQLTARDGLVLGDGADADLALITVDHATGNDPTFTWEDTAGRFRVTGANLAFDGGTAFVPRGLQWPITSPVATSLFSDQCQLTFNGNTDNVLNQSYNVDCLGGVVASSEHAFQMQLETSFDQSVTGGRQDLLEWNWNYFIPNSGGRGWRPFHFDVDVAANGGAGAARWYFKPNNLGSDTTYALELYYPFVAFNRNAAVDSKQDANASFWGRTNNIDPGTGHIFAVKSALIIEPPNDKCAAAGDPFSCCTGAGEGTCSVASTGLHGIASKIDLSAPATTAGYVDAFYVPQPPEVGSGTTVRGVFGLRIDDLGLDRAGYGVGVIPSSAIWVRPQMVSDGSEGNVVVAGTGYNHGHYQVGSTHLWEETPGVLAVKSAPPIADADGSRLVTNARSPTSGPAAWAANGVPCATACANIGQRNCADSIPLLGALNPAGNCSMTLGIRMCECY